MQKSQITLGAEYVVAENWIWNGRNGLDLRWVKRVRAIEKNAARGLLVAHLDPTTGEVMTDDNGDEVREVIQTRHVREEWTSFKERHIAAKKVAAESRANSLTRLSETRERMMTLLGEPGVDGLPHGVRRVGTVERDGSYGTRVHLSHTELIALLEMAHDAGKASA